MTSVIRGGRGGWTAGETGRVGCELFDAVAEHPSDLGSG